MLSRIESCCAQSAAYRKLPCALGTGCVCRCLRAKASRGWQCAVRSAQHSQCTQCIERAALSERTALAVYVRRDLAALRDLCTSKAPLPKAYANIWTKDTARLIKDSAELNALCHAVVYACGAEQAKQLVRLAFSDLHLLSLEAIALHTLKGVLRDVGVCPDTCVPSTQHVYLACPIRVYTVARPCVLIT